MLAYATHACIIAIHLLLAQDNKKMSKEPMHRLTTKEEAEKIMEGLEGDVGGNMDKAMKSSEAPHKKKNLIFLELALGISGLDNPTYFPMCFSMKLLAGNTHTHVVMMLVMLIEW